MTVLKTWNMTCPKCRCDDKLDVTATVCVRLTSDGTDADDSGNGSHEWEPTSQCVCGHCDWSGMVRDAEVAALPLPDLMLALTNDDAARVASIANSFINDWEENEGKDDPDCETARRNFDAIRPLLEKAPGMFAFIMMIARMTTDDEMAAEPEGEGMTHEDAVTTVCNVITLARAIAKGVRHD